MLFEGTPVSQEATWVTSADPEAVLGALVEWLKRQNAREIVSEPGTVAARIGRLRDGYRQSTRWPMWVSVILAGDGRMTSVTATVRSDMRMRLGTERGYARGTAQILATIREVANGTTS